MQIFYRDLNTIYINATNKNYTITTKKKRYAYLTLYTLIETKQLHFHQEFY